MIFLPKRESKRITARRGSIDRGSILVECSYRKVKKFDLDNVARGSGSPMRIAEVIFGFIVKQGKAMRMCSLVCLIICLAISNIHAASFDCKKAKTEIEKMICSDKEVSTLDQEMDRMYKKALALVSYKAQMKKQQQEWIRTLRNACEDEACLLREYRDRIAALNSTLAAAALKRKPEDPKLERERIIAVSKKLKWKKPYDWKEGDEESLAKRQFCEQLLADLQAGREVEFVEPIVRTDDYNDPRLQAYLGRCPKLKPYRTVVYQPRIWEHLEEEKVPEDAREEYGRIFYLTLDFKLYQADFSGNPDKDKEYLLYGGGGFEFEFKERGPAYYSILTLDPCKSLGSTNVNDTVNYKVKQMTGNYNGVLRYKTELYVYDYMYPNTKDQSIRIFHWNAKSPGNTTTACWFD